MPRTSRSPSFDAPNTPDEDTGLPSLEASSIEAQTVGLPASLLSLEQLRSVIESLLFVAGRPLDFGELRRLLLVEERRLREATRSLAAECEAQGRGLRVQLLGNTAQFVSAPENARFVAALLGLPTQVKLTTAALETLAVVAYRQPITRSQIEFIRGVNSDRALASLLQHGLVIEVGRAATVGRPALFGTTPEFLQQFGLTSLDALPKPDLPTTDAEAERRQAAQRVRRSVAPEEEPPIAPEVTAEQ
jgi:segregation and condensation protein B